MWFNLEDFHKKYKANLLDSNIRVFELSDLQLAQKNLLMYEYNTRSKAQWLDYSHKEISFIIDRLVSINKKDYKTNEEYRIEKEKRTKEVNNLLFLSCKWLLEEYSKRIKENIFEFDVFLDLGDLIFNISEEKIQFLQETWLYDQFQENFRELKCKKKKTYLVYWNHDKEQYKSFYSRFFTSQSYFLFQESVDKSTVKVFTHYPISLEKKGIKEYDDLCEYIRFLLKTNRKVINIHWHLHTREEVDDLCLSKEITYVNRCIDYLILKNL